MKIILMFLVVFSSLYGVDYKVLEKDQLNKYDEAKIFFNNKDYQKAYELFYKLFENNLENPNINFYLGRTAYMLKEFELAIAAYERVLNVDENSIRSKLEIAKCYYELKEYKKARRIFLETIKTNLPVNVQQNINLYLGAINSKTQKNFFNGILLLGVNYDSNVANRAIYDEYTEILNDPVTGQIANVSQPISNDTPDIASSSHQEILILNHLYNIADGMKLKNDFMFFAKTVTKSNDYNIGIIQYSPAISYIYGSKYIIDYSFLFNKIWKDSIPLMKNYGFYPKLQYLYSPQVLLGANLKYQKSSTDLATTLIKALEVNGKYIFNEDLSFLIYGQLLSEKQLSGYFIDNKIYMLALSTSYRYSKELTLTPKLQFYSKPYAFKETSYTQVQKDSEFQASLNTTYNYSKSVLVSFDYSFIKHQSNLPNFRFDKHSATANLIYLF